MRKMILILLIGASFKGFTQQQIHFTQFETAPLDLNPALAGVFRGDIRFHAAVRQQWASITEQYQTLYSSVDFPVARNITADDFLAIGINFANDQSGTTQFTANQSSLTLAFSKSMTPQNNNYISVGFQGGWTQRTLSLDDIHFEKQWNGTTFDSSLPNGELNLGASASYFDMGSGMQWFFAPSDKFRSFTGISMFHINKADVNFLGLKERLNRKFSIHGMYDIFIERHNLSLLPKFYFMQEGKNRVVLIGTDVSFHLKGRSEITNYIHDLSVAAGVTYRVADAAAPHISLKWAGFALDFAYDITLSKMGLFNNGMGGPEISITYRAGLSFGKHDRSKYSEVMFF